MSHFRTFLFLPGLSHSPTPRQLERCLDELNAGRPQCPVGLYTLVVPKKQNVTPVAPEATPMVYLNCGHVQVRFHSWHLNTAARHFLRKQLNYSEMFCWRRFPVFCFNFFIMHIVDNPNFITSRAATTGATLTKARAPRPAPFACRLPQWLLWSWAPSLVR